MHNTLHFIQNLIMQLVRHNINLQNFSVVMILFIFQLLLFLILTTYTITNYLFLISNTDRRRLCFRST